MIIDYTSIQYSCNISGKLNLTLTGVNIIIEGIKSIAQ